MFKFLRRNKKGFTLIELIVVFAIIAILAAIAIPTFAGITSEADKAVEIANATSIATAINAHNTLAASNPDLPVITDAESSTLKTDLDNLWPAGLPEDDMGHTLERINFDTNGIAIVDTGEIESET